MGGDDAGDGERRDGLEEEARAVELVERVGALQDFVEDDERVAVPSAGLDELLQPEQLGIEVTDAVGKVIGGTHTAEQREERNAKFVCKDRHSATGQHIVDTDGTEEGTFTCHVRPCNDVIMLV